MYYLNNGGSIMGRTNNEEIKMFILESRKADNPMTYEEIAEKIYTKFGKSITRQGVYELYRKYSYLVMEDEAMRDIVEVFIRVADIDETLNILNELSRQGLTDVKWSRSGSVERTFIQKNVKVIMEYSDRFKTKLGEVVRELDGNEINLRQIASRLSYKGVLPKDSVISSYIDDVVTEKCISALKSEISSVYDKLYTDVNERQEKKKNCLTNLLAYLNERGVDGI